MFLPLSLAWYIFKGHCQIFDFPPVLSENAMFAKFALWWPLKRLQNSLQCDDPFRSPKPSPETTPVCGEAHCVLPLCWMHFQSCLVSAGSSTIWCLVNVTVVHPELRTGPPLSWLQTPSFSEAYWYSGRDRLSTQTSYWNMTLHWELT